MHERRFARTGRPHDGHELAWFHVERHPTEGIDCRFAVSVAACYLGRADDIAIGIHVPEATDSRRRPPWGNTLVRPWTYTSLCSDRRKLRNDVVAVGLQRLFLSVRHQVDVE